MRKNLYLFIVICSVLQICYSYSYASNPNPNRTSYVKYILDSDGYTVKDESVMRVAKDRIYVVRNGKDKYWNCIYKGIEYEPQALKK